MKHYQTTTLDNGLRVIVLPSPAPVVYCGIAVAAGTRHEQPGEEGLAHFCEHLTFKGTRRRTALQVINALEGVGGELNAFTNKEDTVYYCAIKRQHLDRAVDVLTDIVFNSTYPQQEVEKECEVVCDEIESYEDSPAELIFDDIENILFEGHPLGHNILGNAEQLRRYTSDDARRFTARYYRPENCVFFASGDVNFDRLTKKLSKKPIGPIGPMSPISPICPIGSTSPISPISSTTITRHRGTHQAHVMVGTRAFAATDERRWSLYLLNNILGGPGMNSRLNLSLRERRGLVYTVESTMVSYSDTGLWCVYFGCDQADVRRCLRLVRSELDRLVRRPLSDTQLRAAKRQIEGQLAIAGDSREQFALDFAKNFLHHGTERDLNDIMAHINVLTAADLQQTAAQIFAADRLTTLIYD
ncbi:MAG: insulinase family protein [Prevotella sp.]|nr:insulinase family protein [Prevotella sp.]